MRRSHIGNRISELKELARERMYSLNIEHMYAPVSQRETDAYIRQLRILNRHMAQLERTEARYSPTAQQFDTQKGEMKCPCLESETRP